MTPETTVPTQAVSLTVSTRMVREYDSEFGLTNAVDYLVHHSVFAELTVSAKIRAIKHVLDALQEESEAK